MAKTVREECLAVAEKMVFCKTPTEYDALYKKLRDIAPKATFKYFEKNWHNIQH